MDRLEANFSEICESVFQHCPEVGLVSCWMQIVGDRKGFVANPCPAFPYQWLFDDTISATAVRTEALREAGPFRAELGAGFDRWDFVNSVMAAGWVAVTVPALLSERMTTLKSTQTVLAGYNRMRYKMLSRFPNLIARDSQELVQFLESQIIQIKSAMGSAQRQSWAEVDIRNLGPRDILHLSMRQQIELFRRAFRDPGAAAKLLLWRTHRMAAQIGSRVLKTFTGRSSK